MTSSESTGKCGAEPRGSPPHFPFTRERGQPHGQPHDSVHSGDDARALRGAREHRLTARAIVDAGLAHVDLARVLVIVR